MVTWVTLYLPCHCTSERPQQLWVYKSYQFKKILNTLHYQSLHMVNPSLYWDGVQIPWQMMQNIDIPRANITLIRHSSAEVTIKYRAGVHEVIIDSNQIRHELGFRKIFFVHSLISSNKFSGNFTQSTAYALRSVLMMVLSRSWTIKIRILRDFR